MSYSRKTRARGNVYVTARAISSATRWLWLVAVVIVSCASALRVNATDDDQTSILDRFPGEKVSIGSHALHIVCRGIGTPIVVLEAGLGGFSTEWQRVQERLAKRTRVCAYDRAGYGWSDSGPLPRTAMQSALELRALLDAAGEPAPYVLVGQSYGGFIVRLFAESYPDDVSGLVLLDASSPDQFAQLPASALPREFINASKRGIPTLSTPRPITALPETEQVTVMQLMMIPKARRAYVSEMRHFELSARSVAKQDDGSFSMPLIVVSRARHATDASSASGRAERIWHRLQHRMTKLSPRSDHWLAAGAGHLIHVDRPDLVALAVRQAGASEVPLTVPAFQSMPRLVLIAREQLVTPVSAAGVSANPIMPRL